MADQKIFCNVPWTNTHIYWDGSFGSCCYERNPPYGTKYNEESKKYNLSATTLTEWYNSGPMSNMRLQILSDQKLPQCEGCYQEELHGNNSRRITENYKTAIFPGSQFDKSFLQSTGQDWFDYSKKIQGQTLRSPIDWHVDFGNECNLACKMCKPMASSRIAGYFKSWGITQDNGWFRTTKDLSKNWATNPVAWKNFLKSIDEITNINRIHVMGGEPMMSKKFKEFINYLIANNRLEISLSFVTNGTFYDQDFFEKLNFFRSVDIEVSIESFDHTNDYIRQGSDINHLMDNIKKLLSHRNDKINLVLRSVPQLLNVNSYDKYLKFALDNRVAITSNLLLRPEFMKICVLPMDLKKSLIKNYQEFIEHAEKDIKFDTISIGRDISRLPQILITEAQMIISNLQEPEPNNIQDLRKELINWLLRWDREFDLDARDYYPEYTEFLESNGYQI